MKIATDNIDYNALRTVGELVDTLYELIQSKDSEDGYIYGQERAYLIATLGEIKGVIDMAQTMKEVLKA